MRVFARVMLTVALVGVGAGPAVAQVAPSAVLVAAGLDPQHSFDGGATHLAPTVQAALEWPVAGPLALRLGGLGLSRGRAETSSLRVLGVEALGALTFGTGAVRPYAIAGLGAYHARRTYTNAEASDGWRLGVSGGLGLAIPLGAVEAVVETRLLLFTKTAPVETLTPVMVGLRL